MHFEIRGQLIGGIMNTHKKALIILSLIVLMVALIAPQACLGHFDSVSNVFASSTHSPAPTAAKHITDYRGIWLGARATDVRAKLGAPKDMSDVIDVYSFAETETVLFYYDEALSVKAIMATFAGDLTKAPTPIQIFGEDADVKEDGSIFKMVRYEKERFWISYTKTAGDEKLVTIAVQKF